MNKIPERERWLYNNPEALKSVLKGLEQSKKGKVKKRSITKNQNNNSTSF